jgi:hypothetical protein
MYKRFLLLPVVLAGLAAAQTVPLTQNSVTNHDIVTLAKAGFNEDFILDFMGLSRARFDVSVNALAELAKEGLSERLIRAMLMASVPAPAASANATVASATPVSLMQGTATPPGTAFPAPLQANGPVGVMVDVPAKFRPRKMSDLQMALSTQTPYYRSSSFLFGLIKSTVKINGQSQGDRSVFMQLGSAYGNTRTMAPMAPMMGGMHYVVLP